MMAEAVANPRQKQYNQQQSTQVRGGLGQNVSGGVKQV